MAVLAATGAVSAQSSVTLFGTIDLGLGQTTRDQSAATTATTKTTNFAGINSGNATNAIGVRGTEDLGGGLNAGFVYAWSLNPSNVANNGNTTASPGGNGSPFGQVREANLSLRSATLGGLIIGTQQTTAFAYASNSAAIQNADVGGSFYGTLNGSGAAGRYAQSMLANGGIDTLATARTASRAANGGSIYLNPVNGLTGQHPRYSDMLTYATPVFNGLSGAVSYVRTKSTIDVGVDTSDTRSDVGGYILRADYSKAPLEVHYAYTHMMQKSGFAGSTTTSTSLGTGVNTNLTATTLPYDTKMANHLLNVSYNLGVAQPWVMYTHGKNETDAVGGAVQTGTVKAKGYEIGVKVPVGAFSPYALVGRGKLTSTATNSALIAGEVEVKAYQVGVKYSLSKRTTTWAAFGESKMETTAGATLGDLDKVKGYRIGVTHTF